MIYNTQLGGNSPYIFRDDVGAALGPPAFFFPTSMAGMSPLRAYSQAAVVDVAAAGFSATMGVGNWWLFYLPFNIIISRYVFQIDANGTAMSFYCGMYSYPGRNLVFDIGKVSLSGVGLYGKGAAIDPGTNLFDANGNPTNSVFLAAGFYLFTWAASGTAGPANSVNVGSYDALFNETMLPDTLGLQGGLASRSAHASTINCGPTHMPATIGTPAGASASVPPAVCFIA